MSRNRISIMAAMLDVAREGALKNGIMYGAKLSLFQLNTFIEYLKSNELLEEKVPEDGSRKFYTTPKGLLFIEKFRTLKELFSGGEENYPF